MSQRTQIYLAQDEHRRLKMLAASRQRSLTDLVREAVGRYLREELGTDLPPVDEIATDLYGESRYAGVPPGAAGLVARMQIREGGERSESKAADPEDTAIGLALSEEHERHVADWHRRRAAE